MDFGDDVTLLTDSCMVMAASVMKMEQATQRLGINIGAKKSESLYIGRGESDVSIEDVRLIGQTMKAVDEFTKLGRVMASIGKFTQDIERRRAGATRAFGILRRRLWRRREISVKVKMKIFNAVVLPILLYGATT